MPDRPVPMIWAVWPNIWNGTHNMPNHIPAAALTLLCLATAAPAQTVSGDLALGVGSTRFTNTDDDATGSRAGLAYSGHLRAQWESWSATIDLNGVNRNTGSDDFDDYIPDSARALGLHLGRDFGTVLVGAFVGLNGFQSDDTAGGNGYRTGHLYGVEGTYALSGTMTLFAQLGRAKMVGDPDDVAFDGTFGRAGLQASFDRVTLILDYEAGRSSDIFEDSGDWGEYAALGLAAEYRFKPDLIGTLDIARTTFTANTEDDGSETTVAIGLRVPFGQAPSRNLLTTSYRPGLAAAWASTLD